MGKKNRLQKKKGGGDVVMRSDVPLDEQFTRSAAVTKQRKRKVKDHANSDDEDVDQYIDPKTSERLLSTARLQKNKYERADYDSGDSDADDGDFEKKQKTKRNRKSRISISDIPTNDLLGDDDDGNSSPDAFSDSEEPPVVHIDPHEEKLLAQFITARPSERKTLAELIQAKIDEKQSKQDAESVISEGHTTRIRKIHPKVVEMFHGVREVLSKYRSGKLPKAFKIIPKLINWEQVLALTEPDKWTAAAMYQATRIFASNLNSRQCERFYNLVLLPRVRDDIAEFKKLNFHLYQAVHKSLFKAGAFFKGLLLPLCAGGDCARVVGIRKRYREAVIIASCLSRCSIPMLHTAACMMRLAQQTDYSGAQSIFLRTLIDKKYTLPHQVVDALVEHFIRFESDERELPVLWHQCLLAFVQRYKLVLSDEQNAALVKLTKGRHYHHQISEEVRRELQHAAQQRTAFVKAVKCDHAAMEVF